LTPALAAAAALALSAAAGCGPIEYISQVTNRAASAVDAAKLAQADRYAPYEYTAAQEYLHKAREEAGYSEYQVAIEFGRRSEELADRARAIAVAHLSQGTGPAPAAAAAAPAAATGPAAPARAGNPRDDEASDAAVQPAARQQGSPRETK
jgi:hypothetical protein